MFKYIKILSFVVCVALAACNSTNSKPLSIRFSSDSSKIIISAINEAGLYQLKANINTDSNYQKLVSVLQTPAEDDSTSMEVEWPGNLSVAGDSLIFTPTLPFEKKKEYLVETILNAQFASGKDIIKSKVGFKVKAQQQILQR
jgi:flagellar capping protein FliD